MSEVQHPQKGGEMRQPVDILLLYGQLVPGEQFHGDFHRDIGVIVNRGGSDQGERVRRGTKGAISDNGGDGVGVFSVRECFVHEGREVTELECGGEVGDVGVDGLTLGFEGSELGGGAGASECDFREGVLDGFGAGHGRC